jgi:hypothetical protein
VHHFIPGPPSARGHLGAGHWALGAAGQAKISDNLGSYRGGSTVPKVRDIFVMLSVHSYTLQYITNGTYHYEHTETVLGLGPDPYKEPLILT